MKKLSLMFSREAKLRVKTSKTIFSSRVDINLILNLNTFIKRFITHHIYSALCLLANRLNVKHKQTISQLLKLALCSTDKIVLCTSLFLFTVNKIKPFYLK